MTTLSVLATTIDRIETNYKNELVNFKTDLASAFSHFLTENPRFKAVKWDQYAPSFNDGDACVFSVHTPKYLLSVAGEDEIDYLESYEMDHGALTEKELVALQEFESVFHRLPASLMEYTFGSSATVTATATGFEIADCDCEW
jgi:hypothetical protein